MWAGCRHRPGGRRGRGEQPRQRHVSFADGGNFILPGGPKLPKLPTRRRPRAAFAESAIFFPLGVVNLVNFRSVAAAAPPPPPVHFFLLGGRQLSQLPDYLGSLT